MIRDAACALADALVGTVAAAAAAEASCGVAAAADKALVACPAVDDGSLCEEALARM